MHLVSQVRVPSIASPYTDSRIHLHEAKSCNSTQEGVAMAASTTHVSMRRRDASAGSTPPAARSLEARAGIISGTYMFSADTWGAHEHTHRTQ